MLRGTSFLSKMQHLWRLRNIQNSIQYSIPSRGLSIQHSAITMERVVYQRSSNEQDDQNREPL